MHRSNIEWTDYSGGKANFVWRGSLETDCKCDAGCANCYVDRAYARLGDGWPRHTTTYPDKLEALARVKPRPGDEPYRRGPDSRPMIFVCDTGDLFHRLVPTPFIWKALDTFLEREDIDWQILTKRADRMQEAVVTWLAIRGLERVPEWIWLGVSASNQHGVDLRVPWLLRIPAAVRFISLEPLLERVNLDLYLNHAYFGATLSWIITGGESGDDARLSELAWFERVAADAEMWGVPFFFKRFGDASTVPEDEQQVWISENREFPR